MSTKSPRIDKTRLAIRFGNMVDTYDDVTPVQAEMAKILIKKARDHFSSRPVSRILELGCGTGRMTHQLATFFPEADITALDISAKMIQFASTRYANVNYIVADAEAFLQDTQNTYDLIISNAAIQWFEQVDATLTKACSLLTTKGILMVSTFGDLTFKELGQAFKHAYAKTGHPEIRHVVAMRAAHKWRRMLPDATISEQLLVRSFPDVRQFLRSVQKAGAVNSMSGRYFLCREVLREMSRYYSTQFSNLSLGHINATYHCIYINQVLPQID